MKKFLTWIALVAVAAAAAMGASKVSSARKFGSDSNKEVPAKALRAALSPSASGKRLPNSLAVGRRPDLSSPRLNVMAKGLPQRVNPRRHAPARSEGVYPLLMGSMIASDTWTDDAPIGVYSIPFNDESDFECAFRTEGAWNGVALDGVYYSTQFEDFFGTVFIEVFANDMESGELLWSFTTDEYEAVPMALTVDPSNNQIYGFFYNQDGTGYTFGTIEYSSSGYERTVIREMDGDIWCALAVNRDGDYYAIERIVDEDFNTLDSKLYFLDKDTGETWEVGSTGQFPKYISSAIIDPKTNRMYWNVCPSDYTGWLCEVSLATGEAEPIYQFPGNEEIVGMYIAADATNPDAPAALESVNIFFPGGSLEGYARVMLPETFYDGTETAGELEVIVETGSEIVGHLDAHFGEEVDVPIEVDGAGLYTFKVYARNEDGDGPKTVIHDVWVGSDTPESPSVTASWADGTMTVQWTAVTGSINEGYINPDEITYTIYGPGYSVVARNLTETSYSFPLPEPEEITTYRYEVVAIFDGNMSDPGISNAVVLGAVNPPYIPDFETDELSGWTVIDANADDITWTAYRGYVRIKYNMREAMDDWLITPPIRVEAGKAYAVTFTATNQRSDCTERLEVKYGTAPTAEGMVSELLPPTEIGGNRDPHTFTRFVTADADGKLYIGFHGISDKYQLYLNLSDISVEEGVSALAPGEVTGLAGQPASDGSFRANLSFTAPSVTINGRELKSISRIEVERNGTLVKTFDSPAPGAALSFEDVAEEGGPVQYVVTPYNAEGKGIPSVLDLFLGTNIPAAPMSVNISTKPGSDDALLTWDEVTEDYLGNPIAPGIVKYNIYRYEDETLRLIAENVSGTEYTFSAVESGKQEFVQCAVCGVTSQGEGAGNYSQMIAVGTPYSALNESGDLGYAMGFVTTQYSRIAVFNTDRLGIPGQDDDRYFAFTGYDEGAEASMITGLVSLEGAVDPGLSFYVYNIFDEEEGTDSNIIAVSVKEQTAEDYVLLDSKTVDEWCGGVPEAWSKVKLDLSPWSGKVVQVKFTVITKLYLHTLIDNISIGSMFDQNLKGVSITGPAKAERGKPFNLTVKVSNVGNADSKAFSLDLYADGVKVASKNCAALKEGNSLFAVFSQELPLTAIDPVAYNAVVVYADDQDDSDNSTPAIEVAPRASYLPSALDLTADPQDSEVALSWVAPDLETIPTDPITEDFEDADAFSDEFGQWMFVDMDKASVGGVMGNDIPNIEAGITQGSFWIWDSSDESVGGVPDSDAHSGTKYLFALFRMDDGPTDDWAISPALCGKAQTISFYARSLREDYPEKIEVYYSTGSTNPNDFILVEGAGAEEVPEEWTLYEAELPEGATRFAIRSCATGSFMLMVDDVTYIPGTAAAGSTLLGYDLYRNGERLNAEPLTGLLYSDSNVKEGEEYSYQLVTVYSTGYSEPTAPVTILFLGGGVDGVKAGIRIQAAPGRLLISGAEGEPVEIWNMEGLQVYGAEGEAKMEIALPAGLYIVKAGPAAAKVLIP